MPARSLYPAREPGGCDTGRRGGPAGAGRATEHAAAKATAHRVLSLAESPELQASTLRDDTAPISNWPICLAACINSPITVAARYSCRVGELVRLPRGFARLAGAAQRAKRLRADGHHRLAGFQGSGRGTVHRGSVTRASLVARPQPYCFASLRPDQCADRDLDRRGRPHRAATARGTRKQSFRIRARAGLRAAPGFVAALGGNRRNRFLPRTKHAFIPCRQLRRAAGPREPRLGLASISIGRHGRSHRTLASGNRAVTA